MTSRIVVAGGGPAALEAVLALQALDLPVTLVCPDEELAYRPMAVAEPFAAGVVRRYPIAEVVGDGVELVRERVASVDRWDQVVRCESGAAVPFDLLLVALGSRSARFPGPELPGLVRDVEDGTVESLAFVAPPGAGWTLPLYEVALHMARRASAATELSLVTHESRPLEVFGQEASALVERLLADAGVALRTAATSGAEAERTVALPVPVGPGLPGLPCDPAGFLPVDERGLITGTQAVYAAGDATTYPLKQGGLATQQAEVAATSMARAAGAYIPPASFRPVLRAVLLDGAGSWYLRRHLDGRDPGSVSRRALWYPPTKIAGRHLAVRLAAFDEPVGVRRRGYITLGA